mmetsp:Transcript_106812/g.147851  ORF Transcript_106812/g.147851 Transcript_106812/m.147851 type:complete len:139 (-) Transcript_106812:215-631(-)
MISAFAMYVIVYAIFFNAETKAWVTWALIISTFILSTIISLLMIRTKKLGLALVAGWGGFFFSLALNGAVLYLVENKIVFWCTNIGSYLVIFILALPASTYNLVYIASTSFTGAYLINKGISIYCGGFPNEFTLINQI